MQMISSSGMDTDTRPPFKKRKFLADPVKPVVAPSFGNQLRDFTGESIDDDTVAILEDLSQADLQRALNMWFDGSWRQAPDGSQLEATVQKEVSTVATQTRREVERPRHWKKLYLGAFGCQGYLTTSTTLQAGQKLLISRQSLSKVLPKNKSTKAKIASRPAYMESPKAKINYITRFCTPDGTELGRVPQDEAMVMSTLLDLDICTFEGVVIYAPERSRTGSNIDLQIACYIKKSAFQAQSTPSSGVTVDDSAETAEERMLKMRRFSLLKLLDLIGLSAVSSGALKEAQHAQEIKEKAQVTEGDEEEGTELQADQLDSLYSKAQTFDHNMPMMEPADTFAFTLKPYQKQALHWMVNKEQPASQETRKSDSMHPLWERIDFPESEETKGESVFYMNPYSGELSLNFPRAMDESRGGILADEMGLGKTIEILSLVHTARMQRDAVTAEKVHSHPMMSRTTNKCHTTLVIAPLTLLQQWQSEAENASKDGTLKTMVYYGAEKALDLQELCHGANARLAPDLIITSYGVVLSEYTRQQDHGNVPSSGLFGVEFFRVVLDEAHTIKNRQAKTSKACYALQANRRWALTGTPIVNKLEDLFSLVHYLSVEPWGHFAFWRTFITIPFESKEYIRALDVVQTVLEPLVLRRTKDMKDVDGKPIVDLPSKTIEKVYLEFSENERDIYNFISARARRTYNLNAQAGTVMKNYSYILSMILRLRQACCDPTLVKQKPDKNDNPTEDAADDIAEVDELQEDVDLQEMIAKFSKADQNSASTTYEASVLKEIQNGVEQECPICTEEPIQDPTVTSCFHMACKKCLLEHIEFQKAKGEEPLCHTCRALVQEKNLLEVVRTSDELGEHIALRPAQQTLGSAKIDKLLKSLHETRRLEPRIKSVVFSQFTSFLDIIQKSLHNQKLPFCRLDGSMALKDRAVVLEKFRMTPGNMTLIISLKAGGVGLNLTSANHVYMLDPWWSFAIESQAIDRIHRMGQIREVKVFRYIIANSVEEKMLKIQDRKNFLASSLGMSKEEKRRETLKDIEMLFED